MRGEEDTRLDPAALEELREPGGDEFLTDLVDTFFADAPPLLAALRGQDVGEVRQAAAMQEDREACCAAGMDDYVAKPIRPEALSEALRQARP